MKISNQNVNITAESLKTPVKKKRVVDAVVIHAPDLGLYLKLQNLMIFFLDCLKNVLTPSGLSQVNNENIERCIQHIELLYREHKFEFDFEVRKAIGEFFDEVGQFRNLVQVFKCDKEQVAEHGPADALITAKSSRLQWLSVCILEELKHPFSKNF